MYGRGMVNAFVGYVVGVAGGLIGLGGAELRLPYLVGALKLPAHQAVRANLAISLFTITAAIPARLATMTWPILAPFLAETLSIAAGAVVAAYIGAGWLKRLSGPALTRLIFALLVALGIMLLVEAMFDLASEGLLPNSAPIRLASGFLFGLFVGAISSVLGVAGGEVIIPTLVLAYGVPIKVAGSLSLMISLPAILAGLVRHVQGGALADRAVLAGLIVPMGLGSAAGAATGGLLVGFAPADALKVVLGALLIWSAFKVFAHQPHGHGAEARAIQTPETS